MKKMLVCFLVLSALLFWLLNGVASHRLIVSFFDIGQGDSIFIQAPYTGHSILVDGGPDDQILAHLSEQLPFYDQRIDLLILTHNHADHLNGLIHVLKKYPVSAVLISGDYSEKDGYQAFISELYQQDIVVFLAHHLHDIQVGPLVVDILFPYQSATFTTHRNPNNSSVALRIQYGAQSILLTGDSEIEQLAELFVQGSLVKADIFKAAHHGSHNGIYEPFMSAVSPQHVVIQSGYGNNHGHPHEAALNFFQHQKMRIYRNDELGSIRFAL